MVSSRDKEYNNRLNCFIRSGGRKNYKHKFLTLQNKNQSNKADPPLTQEEIVSKMEIDGLLAEALNQLTFDERQRQLELLHGVEEEIIEDADAIESALRELDEHITRDSSPAYDTAKEMDPQYVNARELRLMFLRCNRYDTKAAADQVLQFFDFKQQLFGRERLVKDITIDDLDENDLESLNSGQFRIIGKDRSNRIILVSLPALRSFGEIKSEMRAHYYFTMSLLKSEEAQLKGIAGISYEIGDCKGTKSGEGILELARLSLALPIHQAAMHIAIDDIRTLLAYKSVIKIMPAKVRARIRIHYGSHIECQHQLATFGISSLVQPLDRHSKELIRGNHSLSIQIHGSGTEPTEWSHIQAAKTDVVFTSGRSSNYKGNNLLRNLVVEYSSLYYCGTNEMKRVVVEDIIGKILVTGGRFLKLTTDTDRGPHLVVVPVEELRRKITQMFRNKKRAAIRRNSVDGSAISNDALPDDVVFGKAPRSPGKDRMLCLIKDRFEEYDALDRGQKRALVDEVIEAIKATGGRFLLPVSERGAYLEASKETSRERISKYFRNQRRT